MTTTITDNNPNGNGNWYGVLVIVASFVLTFLFGFVVSTQHYKRHQFDVTVIDTVYVTVYDTVKVIQPIPRDSLVLRYETVPIFVPDTVTDTIYYDIPIEQKVYGDSSYMAWVSGFHPSLDSIHIRQRTVYQTIEKTTTVYQKRKKWGLGVQAGYGITPNGLDPFIGIGLSYNIVSW